MTSMIHICILLMVASCSACTMPVKDVFASNTGEPLKTIWLVSHGWHAGIVLQQIDISDSIWSISEDFPNAKYLEVGWGDKDFYQTPNPHLGITLKAALLATDSVLHIVGFNKQISVYFPNSEIIRIEVPATGFRNIARMIAKSFARNEAGNFIPLGTGLYGNSHFYLSRERYHLFNTCNVWTARILHAAGLPISPATVITVDSLMFRARKFGVVV